MVAVEREVIPRAASTISADAIPVKLRRTGGTPRQVFAIVLIGTLALAAFASHDLSSWLDRAGDGPILEPLQRAAAQWDGAMSRVGLTRPADALRDFVRGALDRQW